jgi:hypothetical protein
MLMVRERVLVLLFLLPVKKVLENIIAAYLMVSVNGNTPVATPNGDIGKTTKGKAMEQSTLPILVRPTLGSLKTTKDTVTAIASGKMMEQFITGNGRKTSKKDTDFISGQVEMNTMENGKTTREQE